MTFKSIFYLKKSLFRNLNFSYRQQFVCILLNMAVLPAFGQSFGGVFTAGLSSYNNNWGTSFGLAGRSMYYSNASGDGVSKEIHLKLNNVRTGDSVILLSDTVGFEARSLTKNTGWINVNFKSGLSSISGARTGFRLTAGDTAINIEVKYDRTTTMASSTPKKVRFYYKNSQTGVVNTTQVFDLAPRIYILSNVYRWTGATSKNFSTSSNWVPERTTTSSADILIFDQFDTADVEITYSGSKIDQEIGQIMLTNHTRVRFSNYRNNGDNSISTLRLGTSNTNGKLFTIPTFGYPSFITGTGDLALGDYARLFVSGTDTVCIHFKTGAVYQSPTTGNRLLKTLNDRGNGAVFKLYFNDDVSNYSTFRYTVFHNQANTNMYFDGADVTVNGIGETFFGVTTPSNSFGYIGGEGKITVGPGLELDFPEVDNNFFYLAGPIHVLGTLTGNLVSNAPSANTETAWNSWKPNIVIENNGVHAGRIGNQTHPFLTTPRPITGGVEWQMYNSGNRAWRTVGFPFTAMHVSQISRNIVITGTKDATNKDSFYSFNSTCAHCKTSLYAWDESNSAWSGFESGSTANKIDAGEGVLLFFRGLGDAGLGDASASATAGVMTFKGSPVLGDKTIDLTYNSNGGSLKGVNLVANPYMSNVDWNALTRTNVADKFYFYDPAGKMYNTYDNTGSSVVVSGTNAYKAGSALETRTIEQGAAFFAIATGSSATLKFQEADKIATQGSASAFREEREFPCNRLAMTMLSSDPLKKEMDHATLEWDMSEKGASHDGDFMDMPKIYGGYFGIGTVDSKGEWYVIDRRPDLKNDRSETVNMKIASHEKNGSYKIQFEMCMEAPTADVFLVDRLQGKKVAVNNGTEFEFTQLETDALKGDRFALELNKVDAQNSIESLSNKLSVYPNPVHGESKIFIASSEGIQLISANLRDIQGKLIQTWKFRSLNTLELHEQIPTGMYVLEISSNEGISKTKIAISNP